MSWNFRKRIKMHEIWIVYFEYFLLLNMYTAWVDLQSRLCIFKSWAVLYVVIIIFTWIFNKSKKQS